MTSGFGFASTIDEKVGEKFGFQALNQFITRYEANIAFGNPWKFLEQVKDFEIGFMNSWGERATATLEQQTFVLRFVRPMAQSLVNLALHGIDISRESALAPIMCHIASEAYFPKLELVNVIEGSM
jgi:hypothetical protein